MEFTGRSGTVMWTSRPSSDTYGRMATTAGTPSNRTRFSPQNPKTRGLSRTYGPVPIIFERSLLNRPEPANQTNGPTNAPPISAGGRQPNDAGYRGLQQRGSAHQSRIERATLWRGEHCRYQRALRRGRKSTRLN